MKLSVIATLIGATIVAVVACKKPLEVDRSLPVVEVVNVNNSAGGITVNAGDTLHFNMTFSDNQSLQKFRIQILADFIALPSITPYSLEQVETLSATTEETTTTTVVIPPSAKAGVFDLTVEVMDEEGNLSDPNTRRLVILAAGQPVISVTQPNFGSPITAQSGDTIPTFGVITDDEALEQIRISLSEETENGVNTLYLQSFNYDQNLVYTTWSLDTLFTDSVPLNIPASTTSGIYELVISAFDTLGNFTALSADVAVSE